MARGVRSLTTLTPCAAKVTKPQASVVHHWTQRYEWRLLCNLSSLVAVQDQEGALFAALCAAVAVSCLFAMQTCRRVIRVGTSESSERHALVQI